MWDVMRIVRPWLPALLIATLAACNGFIGDPGAEPGATPPDPTGPTVRDPEDPLGAFVPAPAAMRRLTRVQYEAALRDVFGEGIAPTTELEQDENTARFSSIGATRIATSPRGVEQYAEAAFDVAGQVVAQRDSLEVLSGCLPSTSADPCIRDVVAHYGRLLFRRALDDDEVARFSAIVGAAGDDADMLDMGMRYMFSALLQAPSFLYVPAVGVEVSGSDVHRFDGYEMASRLSLFLWNTIPDDELLAAAEAGELDTAEGVAAQTRRMLDDPKADGLASRFIEEAWHVRELTGTSKHMERYPDWSGELLADLRTEVRMVLGDLQEGGDFLQVFDGTSTYVNDRLAGFYGVEAGGSDFAPVDLGDDRTGLLTAAAVIAANSPSDRSTPTERGVFILESLLCREIPAPPADALEAGLEQLAMLEPGDERGFILARLDDPACGGCHSTIDPLGMALDDYDAIGRFRTGGDAIGELPGEPYVDVHDLAASLRGEGEASRCLTKRLLGFGGAHEVREGEEVIVHEVTADFDAGGNTFESLVVSLVASDGFRFLSPEL
jgi:hypothetical protein